MQAAAPDKAPRGADLLLAMEEVGTAELPPQRGLPGREVRVQPFTLRMKRLGAALDAMPAGSPAHDEQLVALVRLCVPEATDDEVLDMTPGRMLSVVMQANGQLELVLAALAAQAAEHDAGAGSGGGGGEGNAAAERRPRRRRSRAPSTSPTSTATP